MIGEDRISIVIPVFNEKGRLEPLLNRLASYCEVIVVDDGSSIPVENNIDLTLYPNVRILRNNKNQGYLYSLKRGIAAVKSEIVITMDGDGEHKPEDIPRLISKMEDTECDIVFGKRPKIARPSEMFLLYIARQMTAESVKDAGTGFRAIKTVYAKKLTFYGSCTCGTLLLECHELGMKICEVDVDLPLVDKPRKIAWDHMGQFFTLWKYILRSKKGDNE